LREPADLHKAVRDDRAALRCESTTNENPAPQQPSGLGWPPDKSVFGTTGDSSESLDQALSARCEAAALASAAEPAVSEGAAAEAARTTETPAVPPQMTTTDQRADLGGAITRQWQVLRGHVPYLARRDARRRALAYARSSERFFARHDQDQNVQTQLPAGEQVRVPVLWLAELFTPTTLPRLLSGVRELTSRQSGARAADDDPVEWIISARRRGGGAWRSLPYVQPTASPLAIDEIVDRVPPGTKYVRLSLHILTSTVTALTAEFGLDDDRAHGLERILNQKFAARAKILPGGGHTILDVERQKASATEEWRMSLRRDAAAWLATRFPGSFDRLAPGQLPAVELLLTGKHRPWEPAATSATPGWARMLDLGGSLGYWQCTTVPALRLEQRRDDGIRPGPRHRLVLAGLEQELLAHYANATGRSPSLQEVIFTLEEHVTALLVRWSLTAFIGGLEEELAGIQDVAEQAGRKRSPRALADTQQQLLRTGIDSRIVVNDIARYAQDPWWKHDVLDFSEVLPPGLEGKAQPTGSLAKSLRESQIEGGQRVAHLETDLREILNTNAGLTSASENLRLQRRILWVTVISVIAAVVAAAAAVIALKLSADTTSTPRAPAVSASPQPHAQRRFSSAEQKEPR
jgi:hypothetical protein